jgi:hypothetical protein
MKRTVTFSVFISVIAILYLVLLTFISAPSLYAEQEGKRPLTHDDYDSWKAIASSAVSVDGQWVLYIEAPQDGDGDLVVKNIKSMKEYRYSIGYTGEGTDAERAANPQFSYDTKHVVFLISPSHEQVKKAKEAEEKEKKKEEEKLKKKLGIMNLSNGQVIEIERVKSFAMPEEAGRWVAYLKEAPPEEEKKEEEKGKEGEEEKGRKREGKRKKEKRGLWNSFRAPLSPRRQRDNLR